MPEPSAILEGLRIVSNRFAFLAIGWHVVLVAVFILLLAGWRPSRRLAAVALALPLLSVAVMAFSGGNPFNGLMFIILAVVLGLLGAKLPRETSVSAKGWVLAAGAIMAAFGFLYPHFLEGYAWTRYLYAAPTGLIPCPTLSVVVGLALLGRGFGGRAYAIVLAAFGLFYGLFGVFRLGVTIDSVLFLGAAALLIQALGTKGSQAATPAQTNP
jgi:hypothetical protein